MAYQQKPGTGSAFKNDRRRDGKNDPEYTGSGNIAGQDYWIDIWVRNRPKLEDGSPNPDYDPGKKTSFSLGFREKQPRPQGGPISSAGRESTRRQYHLKPPPPPAAAQQEQQPGPDGNYHWDADK